MKMLKRLLFRLRNLAAGQSGDPRFLEEMQEHLSLQIEDNLRSGMTPDEARRQAWEALPISTTGHPVCWLISNRYLRLALTPPFNLRCLSARRIRRNPGRG